MAKATTKESTKATPKESPIEDLDSKLKEYEALDKQLAAIGGSYKGLTGKNKKMTNTLTFISTGCISIDRAIKGLVPGRIYEIFGKTGVCKSSVTLAMMAAMQRAGHVCMWIDVEACFTEEYASMCGVDVEKLILIRPDNMNEALEAIRVASSSGLVKFIGLDSVAAMVPKDEFDKDVGGGMLGTRARLLSSALPQIVKHCGDTGCILMCINQVRAANLMGYGCFHEDTLVTFSDGSLVPIKKVVEDKMVGPVLSYDDTSGQFISKKITNWFNNGKLDLSNETWHNFITSSAGGRGGRMGFSCTPNHEVLTSEGYKKAQELTVGTKLISYYESKWLNNPVISDIIYGSLLGDGGLIRRDTSTAALGLQNNKQKEYLDWKMNILSGLDWKPRGISFNSSFSTELSLLKDKFYRWHGKRERRMIPDDLILTPLMAAVWYMDDGSIDLKDYHKRGKVSAYRLTTIYDEQLREAQLNKYKEVWSSFLGVAVDKVDSRGSIYFDTQAFSILCEKIHKYVPPSMQYKLLEEYRGKYKEVEVGNVNSTTHPYEVEILSIDVLSPRKLRVKTKYDIEVEGTHNYLVGGGNRGVVVHNSKSTTTGGAALPYYSSVRMEMNRSGYIEGKGDEKIGMEIKLQTIKNKTYTPFKTATLTFIYPTEDGKGGLDLIADVVTNAVELGVIVKAGSWMRYGESISIQGEPKFKTLLESDPVLLSEIREKTMELINNSNNNSNNNNNSESDIDDGTGSEDSSSEKEGQEEP
jgi:recombination protein RecA